MAGRIDIKSFFIPAKKIKLWINFLSSWTKLLDFTFSFYENSNFFVSQMVKSINFKCINYQTFFKNCWNLLSQEMLKKTFNFSYRVQIYRSTGQRSMFYTSTFGRSMCLYINKNLLKYRTKCHQQMLCRSKALYINHCWSKNHFFIFSVP